MTRKSALRANPIMGRSRAADGPGHALGPDVIVGRPVIPARPGSFPYGTSGLPRLRVSRYRIL